jgi:hypothetical protein
VVRAMGDASFAERFVAFHPGAGNRSLMKLIG